MQRAVSYLEDSISSNSIWLHRILTGKDDNHYSDVIRKLQQKAGELEALYAQKPYMSEACRRLHDFKQELCGMEQRSQELMVGHLVVWMLVQRRSWLPV